MAQCSPSQFIYSDYVFPTLNALAAVSTMPLIYIYIQAYLQKKLKSTSLLFHLGLALFMVIFIIFTIAIAHHRMYCHPNYQYLSNFIDITNGILYIAQSTIVVVILFIRLVDIFKGTLLALSNCIIHSFLAVISADAILGSSCSIAYNLLEEYSPNSPLFAPIYSFWAFSSFVYLILVILLNALFIFKMYKVYHTDKAMNIKILNIITKTTVLCVISSLCNGTTNWC